MRLPSESTPQTQTQNSTPLVDIDEESHLTITLHITPSKRPRPRRPVLRADNVVVESPRYHAPAQAAPAKLFVFYPAPVVFHVSGSGREGSWKRGPGRKMRENPRVETGGQPVFAPV